MEQEKREEDKEAEQTATGTHTIVDAVLWVKWRTLTIPLYGAKIVSITKPSQTIVDATFTASGNLLVATMSGIIYHLDTDTYNMFPLQITDTPPNTTLGHVDAVCAIPDNIVYAHDSYTVYKLLVKGNTLKYLSSCLHEDMGVRVLRVCGLKMVVVCYDEDVFMKKAWKSLPPYNMQLLNIATLSDSKHVLPLLGESVEVYNGSTLPTLWCYADRAMSVVRLCPGCTLAMPLMNDGVVIINTADNSIKYQLAILSDQEIVGSHMVYSPVSEVLFVYYIADCNRRSHTIVLPKARFTAPFSLFDLSMAAVLHDFDRLPISLLPTNFSTFLRKTKIALSKKVPPYN